MKTRHRISSALRAFFVGSALAGALLSAQAEVGVRQIHGADGGVIRIFYPTNSPERSVKRGPFTLSIADDAAPTRGNGRLIVISHGSGGGSWEHSDLARILVESGFVVAMPEHRGDNYKDYSAAGPESWERRPAEISHAIDAVATDPAFSGLLKLDKVGVYGMSAGGHTALTLAGGRWSPAQFTRHCEAHIADDFYSCVGLTTTLKGDAFDGMKKTIALWIIRYRFRDPAWHTYTDPRIAAIVAGVPYAADFDFKSLATPRVPLGLVTARFDKWLVPRFHSEPVLASCASCERVADMPTGGHGSVLSPLPPLSGLLGELMNDPPGFDRRSLADVYGRIAAFFRAHLLTQIDTPKTSHDEGNERPR